MARAKKPNPETPPRLHLFAFYYLGFNPDREYRFANAHHVAKYYNVSSDAVLEWLEETDLTPASVLRQQFDLVGPQLDLQLDAPTLGPHEFWARVAEILRDLDAARGDRKFWED